MMKLIVKIMKLSASTMSLGKSFHFETILIKQEYLEQSSLVLLTYNLKG